jgi:hypothetical protein
VNTGVQGPLYLDGELLQRYLKHGHSRTEQEVYVWMTIFLASAITDYIRKTQDKSIGGEGSHRLLPELEELDREWNQGGRQTINDHGRKHCFTGLSFAPYAADLNVAEHNESKKSRHGN